MNCRICGHNDLNLILDLGYHPPSDAFLKTLDEPEISYPLRLVRCPKCSLAQLDYTVPKEDLFNDEYPYETGTNSEGVKHFAELAKTVLDKYNLGSSDLVVDIGSNDGTLLSHFKNMGCKVLGVEPVKPIAENAKVETINEFWCPSVAKALDRKAKVITATNVFAHVDDLHGFMQAVDILLADDGVFIVEAPHLQDLIDKLAYDTIYHEHLCYFDQTPLGYLAAQYGMTITGFEKQKIHGGSGRYFMEKGDGFFKWCGVPTPFNNFTERVAIHKLDIKRILPRNSSVVGISAPAKGNTLLNFCEIDLQYITDKSSRKVGKFTPGRHIPVYSDEKLLEDQPPYALLLAWNWKDQIKNALSDYRGQWIIPLPELHIE